MIVILNHKCDYCKVRANECYRAPNGMDLCPECIRLHFPPRMLLLTNNIGSTIWNIEVGKYEAVDDIKAFALCGWFTRSIQESVYNIVPRNVVQIHHLEYYGRQQCCRCKDYPYFDPTAPTCQQVICAEFQKKRKLEERNYPEKRSKYYEYLKNSSA